MDAEQYKQVKRLYMAAAELDEQEAATFLDVACAGDEALRQEVESLLAHRRPETLLVDDPALAETDQLVRPVWDAEPLETPEGTTSTDPPRGPAKREAEPDRFEPGTIVAGRYRILGLLGRGGMGEVYRADDLRLEQPVALKFLARSRSADEEWLARFHGEVRLARRVTHPNVNRVYDIGEADGEVFLSMEYVDGENLGSLLRRIGRLPIERALRMARELCTGLGAAHDQGVLHRDLKPANVMIDGLGHVRIMDFGIAVAKSDAAGVRPAGTPAYMAPELFEGGEASVKSDIYSLGVVLYEMVTGKLPHSAAEGTDSSVTAALPAAATETVTPQLERVIRRCLAPDPQDRPNSTYSVLSAIPGGDALAAAVAAGKTPSPEMVAAAAEPPASRKAIMAMAVATIVGLIAVFLLADRTMLLPRANLEKPPAVLIDRAEQLLRQLGYTSHEPGCASGFAIDQDYLDYIAENRETQPRLLPSVYFWYRQGERRLPPPPPLGGSASPRKLPPVEGMNVVHLDGSGRLLRLAVYQRIDDWGPFEESADNVDWSPVFAAAELDPADYEPSTPSSPPPMFADVVVAWECRDASGALPQRIEGAATAGRVVFFDVVLPWERTDRKATSQLLSANTASAFTAMFWLRVITLLVALGLAQHNLRLGRGDVRSARRLAVFVFGLAMFDWLVGERHSSAFQEEASAALLWTSRATFAAAVTWFTYVALEPYVRRLWPQTIVTWTRLIAGRFRDPLVGRDLLVGTTLGIALALIDQLDVLFGKVLGRGTVAAKLPTAGYELGELLGLRYKIGTVISQMLWAVSFGMFVLLLLLTLRIVFRNGRWATVAFVAIVTFVSGYWATIDNSVPWLLGLVMGVAMVIVLLRVGFVALAVGIFVQTLLLANPITLQWDAWYAPAAIFAGLIPLGLAGYGAYLARSPHLGSPRNLAL